MICHSSKSCIETGFQKACNHGLPTFRHRAIKVQLEAKIAWNSLPQYWLQRSCRRLSLIPQVCRGRLQFSHSQIHPQWTAAKIVSSFLLICILSILLYHFLMVNFFDLCSSYSIIPYRTSFATAPLHDSQTPSQRDILVSFYPLEQYIFFKVISPLHLYVLFPHRNSALPQFRITLTSEGHFINDQTNNFPSNLNLSRVSFPPTPFSPSALHGTHHHHVFPNYPYNSPPGNTSFHYSQSWIKRFMQCTIRRMCCLYFL